jgi:8-oxo-dGTP pyrophosphatase MutT (NUDIX family)
MDVRPNGQPVVRAGGGVVWRPSRRGGLVYAVVHRPAYDDWTLPKGKVDGDETEEEAALREVEEEIGVRCQLGRHLGTTSYVDRKGRPKVVHYWLMRAGPGTFTPHDEIDEVRWLPIPDALELLSYERDRTLLASLVEPSESDEAQAVGE